ncbi:MAG: acyltransferase [Burkholderiales bacterium]
MKQALTKKPMPTHRLGYLDTLRGLAALYVVVFHVSLIPKPALEMPSWLNLFVSYGGSGVTLFFVISGFSMCLTWGRHADTGAPFRSFYTARFFRIAPLFYFWLILTVMRDFVFKGAAGLHSASEIILNALFLFNFNAPFEQGIVWASWTIGVEMVFYFIFPIIAIYANTLKNSSLLLLVTLAITITLEHSIGGGTELKFLNKIFTVTSFVYHLPVFLFGIVAFYVQELLQTTIPNKLLAPIAYLLALLSIAGLGAIIIKQPIDFYWYYVSSALYSALLLSFALFKDNVLIMPSSVYIGKISYSLYLNHPNVVYLLSPLYIMIYQLTFDTATAFLICVAITLIILVPLSHLSFRFFEEPFIRLGKRLTPTKKPALKT